EDQAHRVQPHVMREPGERAKEPARLVTRRVERGGGMNVERRVMGLERLEDRETFPLVDIVPLEMGIEHRAAQLEVAHCPFDFLYGTGDIARVERRAGGEAIRVPATGVGGDIVRLARQRSA